MDLPQYLSLIDIPEVNAANFPDQAAIIFIHEDDSRTITSNRQLYDLIKKSSQALLSAGLHKGDVVILVMPQSVELIASFFGVIHTGAVPTIFSFLTPRMDPGQYQVRVRTLADQIHARMVITTPEYQSGLEVIFAGTGFYVDSFDSLNSLSQNNLNLVNDEEIKPSGWDDLAFLQFSSGTTGIQKGVAVTHRAVLTHIQTMLAFHKPAPHGVIASWLPLYHDMGLVASLLIPLANGDTIVLMSPYHWVASPGILFKAMYEYKATRCRMPNFAFNHCTLHIRESDLQGIDLSHITSMASGGEPVTYSVMQNFIKRFSPYGFRPEMLTVGYGLAEATLAVTMTPLGEPPRVDWINQTDLQTAGQAIPAQAEAPGSIPVVSCGVPVPGTEITVLDANGASLPERAIGVVMVRSDFLFNEYYEQKEQTDKIYRQGWVDTGDLGYRAEGELYVCGRKKDLMIIGGRNVHPNTLKRPSWVLPLSGPAGR